MLRSASLALVAALALSACSSNETPEGEVAEGESVAAVAAPAGQAWIDVATVTPDGGYMVGNPDAPIKIIDADTHLTEPHDMWTRRAPAWVVSSTLIARWMVVRFEVLRKRGL